MTFAYIARSAGILVYAIHPTDGNLSLVQTLDFNPVGGLLAIIAVQR